MPGNLPRPERDAQHGLSLPLRRFRFGPGTSPVHKRERVSLRELYRPLPSASTSPLIFSRSDFSVLHDVVLNDSWPQRADGPRNRRRRSSGTSSQLLPTTAPDASPSLAAIYIEPRLPLHSLTHCRAHAPKQESAHKGGNDAISQFRRHCHGHGAAVQCRPCGGPI